MRFAEILLAMGAAGMLFACAAPPQASRPAAPRSEVDFNQGVAFVLEDIFAQMQRLPAFAPKPRSQVEKAVERAVEKVVGAAEAEPPRRSSIAVDTIVESTTGQQTRATERVEQVVYERVRQRFPQFQVAPLRAGNDGSAEYVLVATMTPVPRNPGIHRLSMAMTESRTALVVAQAGVRIRDANLDTTPTAFYRESPALVRDRVLEGQARTAETPPGGQADGVYFERLATNGLINEALAAFNKGDIAGALRFYEQASRRPDGQQLRVLNGLYISYWNLDRPADAEAAFARIVALGLSTNNLAVKFLFRPRTTDFAPEARVSGPYPFWLRQITAQLAATRNCLLVIGHSSRTGSEDFNDRLSLARAEEIKSRLAGERPELAGRLRTSGMGFRENIIGTGTDDSRDALDRRVEFRVVNC